MSQITEIARKMLVESGDLQVNPPAPDDALMALLWLAQVEALESIADALETQNTKYQVMKISD
jgi:hypothetical protein